MSIRSLKSAAAAAAFLALAMPSLTFGQAAQDFSKVEIKTTKLAGNLYMLEGQGGAIGVLAGPDGVFMVDTQFAPLTDKIVAAIKQITDRPIRYVVNTHIHPDHTGGNENFARLGATLMAREQLRGRMAAADKPAPAGALATITYNEPVTLHMNGETVELLPVRNAHTDGDTLVRFVTADVLMPGDYYRAVGYAYFDRNNGGSYQGLIDALADLANLAGPNTRILPGHGPIVDKAAVLAHRATTIAVHDRVAALVKQGKTADEVVAAKVTADLDASVPQVGTTADRLVRALHAELSAPKM